MYSLPCYQTCLAFVACHYQTYVMVDSGIDYVSDQDAGALALTVYKQRTKIVT